MEKMNKNTLDSDHVGRLLLIFTIPAFFALAVHTLYNIVDTIFIGRYVGPLGIAGLSLVFPIQMLSLGIGMMAGMGGASLISRLLGADKLTQAERALGNSFTITAVLSVVLTFVGLANVRWWCRLLGATDNTIAYASDYLYIILIGMFFMTFTFTLSSLIRAGGNAKVPMIGMILSAALNIVLDWVFIVPLEMGVKGAAWATVIAQLIGVVYFMCYYFVGKPEIRFGLKDLKPDWRIIREIFSIGVSALGMTLAGSLSAIVVNRTVVYFGGDMAMSAYGVINRVMMFAMMPAIVVGQGLQPIIGYNFGARRYDRVFKSIKISVIATTSIGFMVFVVLYFYPAVAIQIFTKDKELIKLGIHAAKIFFCMIYLIGFINIGSIVFQSIGKAVQAFLSTVTRSVLFLLPAILIMPRYLELDGVWWAFPISDFLTFVLVLAMLIPVLLEMRRLNLEEKRGSIITQKSKDKKDVDVSLHGLVPNVVKKV